MKEIQLQFHATADELVHDLLPKWLSSIDYFFALRGVDGSITHAEGANRPLEVESVDRIGDVLVKLTPFHPATGSDLAFLRRNPGILAVSLSHLRDGALREAMIGSVTEDPTSLEAWRSVVRFAKRDLCHGAVEIAADQSRRYDARHLYTPGTAALWSQGVRMLAIAGGVEYELVGPEDPPSGT